MKHKHSDLIHAWADGAEIQFNTGDGWYDCIRNDPAWELNVEYRIKPSVCQNTTNLEENNPVVRWLWADKNGTSTCHLYSEQELQKEGMHGDGFVIKLEWSRTEFPE